MFSKLLVPIDFTSVTLHAAEQAIILARKFKSVVYLLHVVEPNQNEFKNAEIQLKQLAEKLSFSHQISVESLLSYGNIFEDISKIAEEKNIDLIVMGTHGLQGLQMVTGSKALKVIAKNSKPFLVTQAYTPVIKQFTSILCPVLKYRPNQNTLLGLTQLAKKFNSKVILAVPKGSTETEKETYQVNLFLHQRLLEIEEIEYEIYDNLLLGNAFETRLMQIAAQKHADLIAVVNLQEIGFFSLPGSSFEQHMITNKLQIPVLVINPTEN